MMGAWFLQTQKQFQGCEIKGWKVSLRKRRESTLSILTHLQEIRHCQEVSPSFQRSRTSSDLDSESFDLLLELSSALTAVANTGVT